MMKRLVQYLVSLLIVQTISAQDLIYEGIAYKIVEGDNVEVVALPDGEKYKGEIHIQDAFVVGDEEDRLLAMVGLFRSGEENAEMNERVIYHVVRIGDMAFKDCTELTKLEMPYSVKEVGVEAIAGCTGLTEVTIPINLDKIDDRAFANSKISYLGIRSGLKEIGDQVFYGLQANDVSMEGTDLKTFGKESFTNSTIKRISLPNGLKSIPENAFSGCENLVYVSFGNTLPKIGENAFRGCKSLTALTLPPCLKEIAGNAFSETNINSISFSGLQAPEFRLEEICGDRIPTLVSFPEEAEASFKDWAPELFNDKVTFTVTEVFGQYNWLYAGRVNWENTAEALPLGIMSPGADNTKTLIDKGMDLTICFGMTTGGGMKFMVDGEEKHTEAIRLFSDPFYNDNGLLGFVSTAVPFVFMNVGTDTEINVTWGPSGIDTVKNSAKTICYDANAGLIAASGEQISVFDISGKCVAVGNDSLFTDSLAKGIYVVRTAGETTKIVVR